MSVYLINTAADPALPLLWAAGYALTPFRNPPVVTEADVRRCVAAARDGGTLDLGNATMAVSAGVPVYLDLENLQKSPGVGWDAAFLAQVMAWARDEWPGGTLFCASSVDLNADTGPTLSHEQVIDGAHLATMASTLASWDASASIADGLVIDCYLIDDSQVPRDLAYVTEVLSFTRAAHPTKRLLALCSGLFQQTRTPAVPHSTLVDYVSAIRAGAGSDFFPFGEGNDQLLALLFTPGATMNLTEARRIVRRWARNAQDTSVWTDADVDNAIKAACGDFLFHTRCGRRTDSVTLTANASTFSASAVSGFRAELLLRAYVPAKGRVLAVEHAQLLDNQVNAARVALPTELAFTGATDGEVYPTPDAAYTLKLEWTGLLSSFLAGTASPDAVTLNIADDYLIQVLQFGASSILQWGVPEYEAEVEQRWAKYVQFRAERKGVGGLGERVSTLARGE